MGPCLIQIKYVLLDDLVVQRAETTDPGSTALDSLGGDARRAAASPWGLAEYSSPLGSCGARVCQATKGNMQGREDSFYKASADAERSRNKATTSLCRAALELKTITAAKQNQLS